MVLTQNLTESIIERIKTEELLRIPASEEEYFSVAYDLPFKIEYHDSEIVTMGLASFWHEVLASAMIRIFNKIFNLDKYYIIGSNGGVQIPKFEGGYYMPDVMVVKGEPQFKKNSTAIITNPYIIVEVLSPATTYFDLSEKFPEYKHLESLQQIIFIHQKKMSVSSYIRSENSNVWLNQDFEKETDEILIENTPISLKDIYAKVQFPQ
jgi:Uma2 family endonuclease